MSRPLVGMMPHPILVWVLLAVGCGPPETTPIQVGDTTLDARSVAYASCRGERRLFLGTEKYTLAVFLVSAADDVCAQVPDLRPCEFGCRPYLGIAANPPLPMLQVVADLPETFPVFEADRTRLRHGDRFSWSWTPGTEIDPDGPVTVAESGTLDGLDLRTERGHGTYDVIVGGARLRGTVSGAACPALVAELKCE